MSSTGAQATPAADRRTSRPRQPDRRRKPRRRFDPAPYLLSLPALVVMIGILGYPLVKMVILSFQNRSDAQIFGAPTKWVGLDNYRRFLTDGTFWHAVILAIVITAASVFFTMVIGVLAALLMQRVSAWARLTFTGALVMAWAVPTFVSPLVFKWMADKSFGVINYFLGAIPGFNIDHNWFLNPWEGWTIIVSLIVWGAVPLIAISIYATLIQIPGEMIEAARLDGANAWSIFRHVTYPMIKPIAVILASISVIWDFQVFNQPWVARNSSPSPDYQTVGIYAFMKANSGHLYSLSSAISVAVVVLLIGVMFFYMRQIMKIGDME